MHIFNPQSGAGWVDKLLHPSEPNTVKFSKVQQEKRGFYGLKRLLSVMHIQI